MSFSLPTDDTHVGGEKLDMVFYLFPHAEIAVH